MITNKSIMIHFYIDPNIDISKFPDFPLLFFEHDSPTNTIYIEPKKIDRTITEQHIELLEKCTFPTVDDIKSSNATKCFHCKIGEAFLYYFSTGTDEDVAEDKQKKNEIVNDIFQCIEFKGYRVVYSVEIEMKIESATKMETTMENNENSNKTINKIAVVVPAEEEIKRAIRLSLEAYQKKPPAIETGDDDDGDDDYYDDDYGGGGQDFYGGDRSDRDNNNQSQFDGSNNNNNSDTDGGSAGSHSNNTDYSTLFDGSFVLKMRRRTSSSSSNQPPESTMNMKESSTEYSEKDILIGNPAHSGTIFFNNFIDSVRDLYADINSDNKKIIVQSLEQRYGECKRRCEQEGKVNLMKENKKSEEDQLVDTIKIRKKDRDVMNETQEKIGACTAHQSLQSQDSLRQYKSGSDKDLESTSTQAHKAKQKRDEPDDLEIQQRKNDFFKKPRLNKSDNTTQDLSEDESDLLCKNTNLSAHIMKRKKCALIIDDSKIIREVFVRALTAMGFTVKQAETGMKGMLQMKTIMFDVVFCDFLMPLLGGLDCVQQYREWEKTNRPWFKQVRTIVKYELNVQGGSTYIKDFFFRLGAFFSSS